MKELLSEFIKLIQDLAPVIYAAATVGIGMFFKFRDIAINAGFFDFISSSLFLKKSQKILLSL